MNKNLKKNFKTMLKTMFLAFVMVATIFSGFAMAEQVESSAMKLNHTSQDFMEELTQATKVPRVIVPFSEYSIGTVGGVEYPKFTYMNGQYYRGENGEVLYCGEYKRVNEAANNPGTNVPITESDLKRNPALGTVLKNGYPNRKGSEFGLTDAELEWATAMAITIVDDRRYDGEKVVKQNFARSQFPTVTESFNNGDGGKNVDEMAVAKAGGYSFTLTKNQFDDDDLKPFFAKLGINSYSDLEKYQIKAIKMIDVAFDLAENAKKNPHKSIELSIDGGQLEDASYVDFTEEGTMVKVDQPKDAESLTKLFGPAIINFKHSEKAIVSLGETKNLTDAKVVDEKGNPITEVKNGQKVYVLGTVVDHQAAVDVEIKAEAKDKDVNLNMFLHDIEEEGIRDDNSASANTKKYQGMLMANLVPVVDTFKFSTAGDEFTGEIVFTKVDAEDHSILLEGAEFKLEQIVEGQGIELATATSDKNGNITLKGLTEGDYKLTETRAPLGYVYEKVEVEFSVDEYGNATADVLEGVDFTIIENHKAKLFDVELEKIDENGQLLDGATMKVVDTVYDQEVVEPTLFEGGKLTVQLPEGSYRIIETEAPEGYHLMDEDTEIKFTVGEDGEIEGQTKVLNIPIEIPEERPTEKRPAKDGKKVQTNASYGELVAGLSSVAASLSAINVKRRKRK